MSEGGILTEEVLEKPKEQSAKNPGEEAIEMDKDKLATMLDRMKPVLEIANKVEDFYLDLHEPYEVKQPETKDHPTREGIKWTIEDSKSTLLMPAGPVVSAGLSYDRSTAWSMGLFDDNKIVLEGSKTREFDYAEAIKNPKKLEKAIRKTITHPNRIPGTRKLHAGIRF